jgi:acyl transferase
VTATHLQVKESDVLTDDGARVAVWRTVNDDRSVRQTPVLVLPGFGRRMRHMAVVARHLAENGFVVYRSDLRNHVGLSEGEIEQFSLTDALEGARAVGERIIEAENAGGLVVVAASLSFRIAIRMATLDSYVKGIVGLVGVVDTRYTLSQAFGADFFALPRPEWPSYAEFERYQISAASFGPDCMDRGWLELSDCIDELERVSCPVTNFCGGNDKWVRIEDIRRAFATSQEAGRLLIEMPDSEHELARNPVAVNGMLRDVTHSVREAALENEAGNDGDVVDLSFDAMAAQTIFERRYEAEVRSERSVGTLR